MDDEILFKVNFLIGVSRSETKQVWIDDEHMELWSRRIDEDRSGRTVSIGEWGMVSRAYIPTAARHLLRPL